MQDRNNSTKHLGEGDRQMTIDRLKPLALVAASVLVLASASAATPATNGSAGAAAQGECLTWEDWNHYRFFGLWKNKYHLISSRDFNPHEQSRWWRPETLLWAEGPAHGLKPQYTLEHGHVKCEPW